MSEPIRLSPLGHTWIIDLDGTILVHNGYLTPEGDQLLPGAKEFMDSIPPDDMVVFLSSRKEEVRDETSRFLFEHGIRFDQLIMGAPYGERILVNDNKPSGLKTSVAFDKCRDSDSFPTFFVDPSL